MPRRTKKIRQRGGAASHDFEAKTEDHLDVLDKILDKAKKGSSPLIFMMYFGAEDWCGPCQRYRPVWDQYKTTKGRKIPMIHVDHKVKEKSKHLSNINIDGFPTNGVYSPRDGSFSPISNIHDTKSMTQLLTTEPSKLLKSTPNNEDEPDSLVPTPTTRAKLIESGRKAVENKDTPVSEMQPPTPPNTENDSLQSSNNPTLQRPSVPARGGSLFQTLLRSLKGLGKPTRKARRRANRTVKN